jgi:predicted ATPase
MTQLCLNTAALPDGVDETVRRFSDGLPFLVEELLASAVDAGSLTCGDVSARGGAVPARFADLVQSRLARLPDDAASVLVEAAVVGPRFAADILPGLTAASGRSDVAAA